MVTPIQEHFDNGAKSVDLVFDEAGNIVKMEPRYDY